MGLFARRASALAAILALALLCRPYFGISGDARVYVGRALANLDAAGVGRDLMYSFDGQSSFSLFPRLLTTVVAVFGAPVASAALAFLAVAAWTAAACLFLRRWAPASNRWLLPAVVLLLPCAYSGLLIRFGEAAAIPRPFAEALVLAGLSALLAGKLRVAIGLLVAATVLHPIVALPGWGVLLLQAGRAKWVWLAFAVGLAVILLAAALGAPVVGRLFQQMDGEWSRGLDVTAPYLFLRNWDAAVWGRTTVQTVTVGLGAILVGGRSRRLAVAVLVIVAGALLVSFGLGDVARSVLVLQLQPWRCLWLLAFLGAATFPIVLLGLWTRGATGRLGAGALVLAWLSLDVAVVAVVASVFAALIFIRTSKPAIPRIALQFGWAGIAGTAALFAGLQVFAIWNLISGRAYSAPVDPHILALLDVNRVVFSVALLVVWSLWSRIGLHWAVSLSVVGCVTAAAIMLWDARAPSRRVLEDAGAGREVRMLVAARPGPVEWLGGDLQPLVLAGRPSWQSYLQSSSNVFSRTQAVEWWRRTDALVDLGAGPPALLDRFPHNPSAVLWSPSAAAVKRLCSQPSAPAWIVTPLAAGPPANAPSDRKFWAAPIAEPMLDDRTHRVIAVTHYAFIPCAAGP